MKKIIAIIFTAVLFLQANAQVDLTILYDNHFPLAESRFLPSKLGLTEHKFEFNVPSLYLWSENNVITNRSLANILNNDALSQSQLDGMLSNVEDKNTLGTGFEIQPFTGSFKIPHKGHSAKEHKELMTLSLELNYRFLFDFNYSGDLLKMFAYGNKQYAGKNADVSAQTNANYMREFSIGFAKPIFQNMENWEFRVGTKLKYIQGLMAIDMPERTSTVYTDPDGRYVDFNLQMDMQSSGLDSITGFRIGDVANNGVHGTGFGVDLGFSTIWKNKLMTSVALVDIGSVTYNKQVREVHVNETFRYEGSPFGDQIGNSPDLERIKEEFNGSNTSGSFTKKLPTRLIFQAEYYIEKESKKETHYRANNFFLTYVQGFNNEPGATTKPFVSVGYTHGFHDLLNVGGSVQVGGYSGFGIGAFASIKAAWMRFGIGTSNILSFASGGKGFDLSTRLSFLL